MPSSPSQETRIALLEHAYEAMTEVVNELKTTNKEIAESIRSMVTLQVQHAETRNGLERAFNELEKHGNDITKIKGELPSLRLIRKWLFGGIGLVGSLLIVAMMSLVIIGK